MACAVCLSQTHDVDRLRYEVRQLKKGAHLVQDLWHEVHDVQGGLLRLWNRVDRFPAMHSHTSPAASHESHEVDQLKIDRDQLKIGHVHGHRSITHLALTPYPRSYSLVPNPPRLVRVASLCLHSGVKSQQTVKYSFSHHVVSEMTTVE